MVNRVIECMSAMLDWDNKSLKGGITEVFYNNASVMVGVAMTREVEIKTVVVLVETLGVSQTLGFREIIPEFSNLKGMLGMRTFLDNEVVKEALPQSLTIMADY